MTSGTIWYWVKNIWILKSTFSKCLTRSFQVPTYLTKCRARPDGQSDSACASLGLFAQTLRDGTSFEEDR